MSDVHQAARGHFIAVYVCFYIVEMLQFCTFYRTGMGSNNLKVVIGCYRNVSKAQK